MSWCSKNVYLVYHLNKHQAASAKPGLMQTVIHCTMLGCAIYLDDVNGTLYSCAIQNLCVRRDPGLRLI